MIEEARNKIIRLFPEWTDYNYHDPGITLLELFAWLKENQQYYLDQIGVENKYKYLKLIGIKPEHKKPAAALIQVQTQEDIIVVKGTKLYAKDICFEITDKNYFFPDDIINCISKQQNKIVDSVEKEQIQFGHKLHYYPFGKLPKAGAYFYIGLKRKVPKGQQTSIYIEISEEYVVRRNPIPIGERMYSPLAVVEFQYKSKEGWKKISDLIDSTYCFITSGFIYFTLEEDLEKEKEGYYIRAVLKENNYDVAPVITEISINVGLACQTDTKIEKIEQTIRRTKGEQIETIYTDTWLSMQGTSFLYKKIKDAYYPILYFEKKIDYERCCAIYQINEEFDEEIDICIINMDYQFLSKQQIGVGNGLPYQEIFLEDSHIEYETLEIMIKEPETSEKYYIWKKVEDFSQSKPEDKHYIFDSNYGVIRFGNGIHGMAPEGEIFLSSYVTTLGTDGNVKSGKINRFFMPAEGVCITNINHAVGGRDEESLEDSLIRAKKYLKKPDCAVTYHDYENYVLHTPGLLIESCKAIPINQINSFQKRMEQSALYLIVKPVTMNGMLSETYKQNIRAHLEQYRLIGTQIIIKQPEYIECSIYADIILKPQYLYGKREVNQTIEQFFERYKEQFGVVISYSKLYGVIDQLECVFHIRSLTIEAVGNGVKRTAREDIFLPPNGVIRLKERKYSFSVS